jgi:hypothetical protein
LAGAGVRARSPVAVAPTQREEHASTYPVPATCARDRAARRAPSPEHPPGASRLRSGVASHADEKCGSIERLARSRTSAGVIRLEPESGMDTVPPFQSKAPRSGRASCRTQGRRKSNSEERRPASPEHGTDSRTSRCVRRGVKKDLTGPMRNRKTGPDSPSPQMGRQGFP